MYGSPSKMGVSSSFFRGNPIPSVSAEGCKQRAKCAVSLKWVVVEGRWGVGGLLDLLADLTPALSLLSNYETPLEPRASEHAASCR